MANITNLYTWLIGNECTALVLRTFTDSIYNPGVKNLVMIKRCASERKKQGWELIAQSTWHSGVLAKSDRQVTRSWGPNALQVESEHLWAGLNYPGFPRNIGIYARGWISWSRH